jgi:hypothetical protein
MCHFIGIFGCIIRKGQRAAAAAPIGRRRI